MTAVAESPECSKEFIVLIWNYLDNVRDKDKYFVIGGDINGVLYLLVALNYLNCSCAPVHCVELCSRAPLH